MDVTEEFGFDLLIEETLAVFTVVLVPPLLVVDVAFDKALFVFLTFLPEALLDDVVIFVFLFLFTVDFVDEAAFVFFAVDLLETDVALELFVLITLLLDFFDDEAVALEALAAACFVVLEELYTAELYELVILVVITCFPFLL